MIETLKLIKENISNVRQNNNSKWNNIKYGLKGRKIYRRTDITEKNKLMKQNS